MSALSIVALVTAASAAAILVVYLVRRPPLVLSTKLWLLAGIGVLPLMTAGSGNVAGYEHMKSRDFCGSCHVMVPHKQDSEDVTSTSLASRHARNKLFGENNCYMCHADYGMFGTVTTKMGGMGHVYYYYTEYKNTPLEEAKKTIHLRKPFPNDTCMQCHSTDLPVWLEVPDHKAALADVKAERISCASGGCHGFAHPFTKPDDERRKAEESLARADAARVAAGKRPRAAVSTGCVAPCARDAGAPEAGAP